MYRKIDNHKRTACINTKKMQVMTFCDDGWEEILDCAFSVDSEEAGRAWLLANGWEEYDPNAALKAQGFVFINGTYQRPAA